MIHLLCILLSMNRAYSESSMVTPEKSNSVTVSSRPCMIHCRQARKCLDQVNQ